MRAILPLVALLVACSDSPSGPSPQPRPRTQWQVTTDTSLIGAGPARTVVLSTTARDTSGQANLTFSCGYSFGDAIADGLPISRSIGFRLNNRQFPVGTLIVTSWEPTDGPSAFWQVDSFRLGAGVVEADEGEIWAAVAGRTELKLWWSDGGITERAFDIRDLGAALGDIDARCRR